MHTSLVAILLSAAPTIGMNGHLPSLADSAAMASLGARSVRMDFNWYDFNPSQGTFTFGYLDPIVQAARANGLSVYATIAYTPRWASSVPNCIPGGSTADVRCENKRPANVSDWAAAVSAVVARYRGQVECWGIWNEPNLRWFFDGTDAQFVNEIFLPAAQAIRAADPGAKICGPELAGLTASSNWNGNKGVCIGGSCIRNGWELDLAYLLDRIGGHLDIVTHHVYKSDAPGVMAALLDGEYFGSLLTHDSVRRVIEAHDAGHREFWLTETGWEHQPYGSYSESAVATRIVDLFAKQEEVCAGSYAGSANDPWPNWTRTYYYHFPYDPGSGWGIVNADGGPKLAYTALKNWAAGRTTTACSIPRVDAGSTDAGGPDGMDAGQADAGTVDGGPIDAGQIQADAGPDGSVDLKDGGGERPPDSGSKSGPSLDAGTPTDGVAPDAGCGCTSAAGAPFLLLLWALAWRRRARG